MLPFLVQALLDGRLGDNKKCGLFFQKSKPHFFKCGLHFFIPSLELFFRAPTIIYSLPSRDSNPVPSAQIPVRRG